MLRPRQLRRLRPLYRPRLPLTRLPVVLRSLPQSHPLPRPWAALSPWDLLLQPRVPAQSQTSLHRLDLSVKLPHRLQLPGPLHHRLQCRRQVQRRHRRLVPWSRLLSQLGITAAAVDLAMELMAIPIALGLPLPPATLGMVVGRVPREAGAAMALLVPVASVQQLARPHQLLVAVAHLLPLQAPR